MKTDSRNGVAVLVPAPGMKLTDGEVVADGEVWLGKFSKPDDWREVPEAEAQAAGAALSVLALEDA